MTDKRLEGAMHLMNVAVGWEPGCWSRLYQRVREMRFDQKHGALRAALDAMAAEQRADGAARGACLCDLPWCGRYATRSWVRTAKELKAMQRKYKGQTLTGEPQSIRCHVHVPSWRLECYVPLVGRTASEEKAS